MNSVYPVFKFGVCLVFFSTKKKKKKSIFFFQTVTRTGRWFHRKPQLRVESMRLCVKKEYTAFFLIEIFGCPTFQRVQHDDMAVSYVQISTSTTPRTGLVCVCNPTLFREHTRDLSIVLHTSAGMLQWQLTDRALPHRAFVQCDWLPLSLTYYIC